MKTKKSLGRARAAYNKVLDALIGQRRSRDARILRLDDPNCCFDRNQACAAMCRAKDEAAHWRF